MVKENGAHALMRCLVEEGIEVIFGYPGGAIMPIYDAIVDFQDKIHHVLVRHEQGAVLAAEGYARVSGKPGICLATSGPGATNLITGIADAYIDSVPIICITGQVSASLLGSDAFQEIDILSMTAPITKWNCQITKSEEVAPALSKAFSIVKRGRPGPILIDITKDAQLSPLPNFIYEPHHNGKNHKRGHITPTLIHQAAELINRAKKPYLFVGHGVILSNASQEVIALAEKGNIPMAWTLLGISAVPSSHPLMIGMLGMHGNYGANVLTNEADLIIAVGMRFDDRVTGTLKDYAPNAQVIHIEIDPVELNKNVPATVALQGDAKEVLQLLLPHVTPNYHKEWINEFQHYKKLEYEKVIDHELHTATGPIRMGEVIDCLSQKDHNNAIIVTDVGQHQMITARYHSFELFNSHITSGGLGTMGFALPAAIGAKFAAPTREVIAIVGDGAFQLNIQELAVLKQEKIAVKIIILNNHYLGMVRQWQELFYETRYSFVELENPDFAKVAEGYGIRGKRVTERSELSAALDEMLQSKESYLLDIFVEKQHNVFPMVPAGASIGDIRLE